MNVSVVRACLSLSLSTGCGSWAGSAGAADDGGQATASGEAGGSDEVGEADASSEEADASSEDADDSKGFVPDSTPPECSIFEQNCPEGEKCVQQGYDLELCVPITGDQAPGETCTSGIDGIDDCAEGAVCSWLEQTEVGEVGTCVAYCNSREEYGCAEGSVCCCGQSPTMCLPICDPLEQDCPGGRSCSYLGGMFLCSGSAGSKLAGDLCGWSNDCAAGLLCFDGDGLPDCRDFCCTPYCDLGIGDCSTLPGTVCVALFEEGYGPAESQHIGLCTSAP